MKVLIQPTVVLILFVTVRCADLSITYAIGRSFVRAVVYGLVALLALIALLVLLNV